MKPKANTVQPFRISCCASVTGAIHSVRLWLWTYIIVTAAVLSGMAQTNAPPPATPTPPPAAPVQRSAADLEKLVAPIALYPDQLIATILPASAYPLEIVQVARFVKDTNNIATLGQQPWDENVKAVALLPDVINQMDTNIGWTSDLGDAFINQPKEVMDAIQSMRVKAQASGSLTNTPQQVVSVTNQIVTNVVEQQTVIVTNEVVQIQPAEPDVIYVPQYNPTVVYGSYPVAYPGYYYASPGAVATASVLSFGAGMAMGAIFANNCDWNDGGVYWGGGWGHGDIDVNRNVNINQNFNRNVNVQNRNVQGQKWQADRNRLNNSGSTLSSAQSRQARGYSAPNAAQARTSVSQGLESAGAARPAAGQRPSGSGYSRPTTGATRPTPGTTRPAPSAGRSVGSQPASRPSPSAASQSFGGAPSGARSSAFSGAGGGGGSAQSYSQRGSMSRGGGGGAARGGGGGGGRRR